MTSSSQGNLLKVARALARHTEGGQSEDSHKRREHGARPPVHRGTVLRVACVLFLLSAPATTLAQTAPVFFVRSYGGKCLDFGPPPQVDRSPVFLFDCNGTVAQQVRVQEINDRHEVMLRAGSKVIGITESRENAPAGLEAPAPGAAPASETPLELQNEVNPLTGLVGGRRVSQIFALDGDSIILVSNRSRVVKVQHNRSANRTPLVLGRRDLADAEFWTFTAVDGSNAKPTRGFVRVPQDKPFVRAYWEASWGTVIEIDPGESINMQDYLGLPIPAGVTIRGNRRGTLMGPELWQPHLTEGSLFKIFGTDVRITGLRLRGPSRSLDSNQPYMGAVLAPDHFARTIIDHNDLSDWTVGTIGVAGEHPDEFGCSQDMPPSARPQNVRVVRNFIHDNQREGGGYGVVVGGGGYAYIEGNTFLRNRHAIAADGTMLNGYSSWFNLVLADAPCYGGFFHCNHEQDFDMHGSDSSSHHTGGSAGSAVEIARNTFLGTNRRNFDLRGQSCGVNQFHNNIMRQSAGDAIRWFVPDSPYSVSGDQVTPSNPPPAWLAINNNQFNAANPTDRLAVGDFDGDGKDDLFLATGAAWYYAPAGQAEWRYLNDMTVEMGSLLFGDFDGDGRTDVFTQRGREWFVSWGGASPWEKINESDARMTDFAIGDFDGDHRADVFYADGQTWFVSSGGVTPFTALDTSSFRISDLRFGDFNGDGKTDVFSVVSGQWMVSYGGTSGWQRLRAKLTDSVANLTVGDFNGDGRADVATSSCSLGVCVWQVSYSGTGDWTTILLPASAVAATGRFDGNASADVLLWHDDYFDIASGGAAAPHRHSRQNMR